MARYNESRNEWVPQDTKTPALDQLVSAGQLKSYAWFNRDQWSDDLVLVLTFPDGTVLDLEPYMDCKSSPEMDGWGAIEITLGQAG